MKKKASVMVAIMLLLFVAPTMAATTAPVSNAPTVAAQVVITICEWLVGYTYVGSPIW